MPKLSDLQGIYLGSVEIQKVYLGTQEIWSAGPEPAPINPNIYLTFTSTGGNTLSMVNSDDNAPLLYYSFDTNTWYQWNYMGLNIPNGQSVYICGDNPNGFSSTIFKFSNFVLDGVGNVACSGNIMSLLNYSTPTTTIPCSECFYQMFNWCENLTTAPSLPATTLASGCYSGMFYGCTSLTTAPSLPATTLAAECYSEMFAECTSLTTAPSLPATTLASGCYSVMFYGCTSLTTAPSLPATTLADGCYQYMFEGCTSLTTAPSLPVTTLASGCYSGMFEGCTSLTTAPSLPATTLADGCYQYMFAGCTSLTTAPSLPATTLADGCYQYMFAACASLSSLTCLATDISANACTDCWLEDVSPTGTFVKNSSMTSWPSGSSGIPSGWTINNYLTQYLTFDIVSGGTILWKMEFTPVSTAKTISYRKNNGSWTSITSSKSGASISVSAGDKVQFKGSNTQYGTSDYSNYFGGTATFNVSGNIMSLIGGDDFSGLTALTSIYTFKELFYNCHVVSAEHLILPATTLTASCYRYMFFGCSSLTTAPELPATTLASYCYYQMFFGCSSLTTAPELPATTLASSCYYQMFYGCTSLTTAPSLPATTLANYCYFNMFYGCTSLTTAPELPATTLASYCYYQMFYGCTNLNYIKCLATNISASSCTSGWVTNVSSTGIFIKNSSMTSWTTGTSGIPSGWSINNCVTNYLKLSGTSFDSGSSGTVIEVGSGYDISDLTNNPPIIYDGNGNQLTCTLFQINGTWLSVVMEGLPVTDIITYANPQTYQVGAGGFINKIPDQNI